MDGRFSAWLDGMLDEAGRQALAEDLRRDPALRREAAAWWALHRGLESIGRGVDGDAVMAVLDQRAQRDASRAMRTIRTTHRRRRWWPALAAAAILVMSLGAWWVLTGPRTPFSCAAGSVVVADGWTRAGPAGATLSGRGCDLRLAPGAAVRSPDPSRIDIAGSIAAEIHPRPNSPLCFAAAGAEVVVVGTSLDLAADDEALRVLVRSGSVDLRRPGQGDLRLRTGDTGYAASPSRLVRARDALTGVALPDGEASTVVGELFGPEDRQQLAAAGHAVSEADGQVTCRLAKPFRLEHRLPPGLFGGAVDLRGIVGHGIAVRLQAAMHEGRRDQQTAQGQFTGVRWRQVVADPILPAVVIAITTTSGTHTTGLIGSPSAIILDLPAGQFSVRSAPIRSVR
jgi:ferric-dicitrate binding protein FerR (iron transport regulator)